MEPHIHEALDRTRSRLAAAVDPDFREGQAAYFKHEVDSWGVRSPVLTVIAAELYRHIRQWPLTERDQLFCEMWRSGKLEEGALVCYVARRFRREFGNRTFGMFERWLDEYVHNWAHCDGVASWLLAGCIAEEPVLARRLEPWTESANRWKRRAAAVALLQEAKAGRATDQILRIASLLAEDEDEMVQKGVGWVLKEAYPHQPKDVVLFLHRQRDRFSRLTLRTAAEKMSARHREVILRPEAITRSK